MAKAMSPLAKYGVAVGLGVLVGALLVGVVARVLPRAMSGMMREMMTRCGGEDGHDMPDMCRQMMSALDKR